MPVPTQKETLMKHRASIHLQISKFSFLSLFFVLFFFFSCLSHQENDCAEVVDSQRKGGRRGKNREGKQK